MAAKLWALGQITSIRSPVARKTMTHSTLDLYTSHFGLSERPFSLVPDPDFLYWSPVHQRAYTMLEYGILTRAPITLITGEVGAGKTTLLHHLLRSVGEEVTIGLIANAHGDRGELLRWVLLALPWRLTRVRTMCRPRQARPAPRAIQPHWRSNWRAPVPK